MGAWHGFTTMHLAQALKDNGGGEVTVIDDFSLGNSAAVIHNNLASIGCADMLRIVSGKSREVVWPDKVDFAFIDGDHSFEGCVYDCDQAISRGAECVCVHDSYGWWGPRLYTETMREQGEGVWDTFECGFDSGLAVFVKRPVLPPCVYTEKDYPQGHV